MSKTKNESLFEVEKKLKKMALSNRSFFNYMNKYTKLTQNFTFKTPNISMYPKKKNQKYLPISYLEKIGYKNLQQDINDENKNNYNNNENIENKFNNLNDFNNFDKVNLDHIEKENNDEYDKNEDRDNIIKEKPYGFKFKDTRIIYDKSKMRVKSSLFKSNNSEFNLTNINTNHKNKTNFNFHINKEEKRRNKIFKYFYEGDFLQNQNQRRQSQIPHIKEKNKRKKNIVINDNDVNSNIQMLYDMIKNIKNVNNFETNKSMKYNIKNNYKNQDFSFQADIESLCLKFINQNCNLIESEIKDNNNSKNISSSQKLYLPFSYLPIFYLLDYTSFKIFLSEIIYYNKESNMLEINQNELLTIVNKYKKFITVNVINQDSNKKKKMEKITYHCKEHHFQNEYDWIIYLVF